MESVKDDVQCVVGKREDLIDLGMSQSPTIIDYPDGVDIRLFIDGL